MMILLVEDELLIAMTLEAALTEAGYSVAGPVPSAKEALELVERDAQPVLAIVNIDLRDGRGAGIKLARELLSRWRIPSLFVSGQRMEALANRDVALGYVNKPYSPQTIVRSVAVALRSLEGRLEDGPPPPLELELFHAEARAPERSG